LSRTADLKIPDFDATLAALTRELSNIREGRVWPDGAGIDEAALRRRHEILNDTVTTILRSRAVLRDAERQLAWLVAREAALIAIQEELTLEADRVEGLSPDERRALGDRLRAASPTDTVEQYLQRLCESLRVVQYSTDDLFVTPAPLADRLRARGIPVLRIDGFLALSHLRPRIAELRRCVAQAQADLASALQDASVLVPPTRTPELTS
jgi:hypothetical protein